MKYTLLLHFTNNNLQETKKSALKDHHSFFNLFKNTANYSKTTRIKKLLRFGNVQNGKHYYDFYCSTKASE